MSDRRHSACADQFKNAPALLVLKQDHPERRVESSREPILRALLITVVQHLCDAHIELWQRAFEPSANLCERRSDDILMCSTEIVCDVKVACVVAWAISRSL